MKDIGHGPMWQMEPGSKLKMEPRHAIYFLFQKVDVAANTMAAAASESEQLVTTGLQICLQFDRVGVWGGEAQSQFYMAHIIKFGLKF